MKLNKTIIILTLFIVLLCAIGSATASEDVNGTDIVANDALDDKIAQIDDDSINEEGTEIEDAISDGNDEEILGVDGDEPALSENESGETMPTEKVIWVGHTNTTEGGNGTEDNPFSTLSLACSNVSGEDKITLNIYSGTYYLGSELKFNTSNLIINGIDGVVIKSSNINYPLEAFELTSSSSNFTMNNIIFDASDHTKGISINPKRPNRSKGFLPFYGIANEGIFNNCTFTGFKTTALTGWSYNSLFSNCIFEEFSASDLYFFYDLNERAYGFPVNQGSPTFKNCMFLENTLERFVHSYNPSSTNCSFIECWFGQNEFPNYLYVSLWNSTGANPQYKFLPVYSYAIFSVYENYLGNNQYEIVGKLTWNGTDNQDGMENFQPMTVNLVSTTGDINQTATLVNGNFRAVYTSSNINHKVTATLDDEEIELNFNNTDIVLDAPAIKYGEDQNITITFQQPINSTITITINNNKTYGVKVNESNSINFTIKDLVLTEGDYNISVSLIDEVNHIYGSNSTILSVSKYDTYIFVPEIVDTGDIKVGDNVTVKLVLPEDVSGNITVYINNNPVSTKDALKNNEINVTGLVAGDNTIIVTYNGNDKYASKSTEPQIVTVYKVSAYDFDVVVPTGVKVGEDTNITIKLPGDVSGNALVYIGNQDSITVPISGESTIVSVSGLVAGNNTVKVVFSDDKYAEKTLIKNITVEKLPVEITNNTIVVNAPTDSATPTVSIDIPGATGNLTVIINNKTFTAKLENGTATVTIKDVPAGTYNATVIYSGDDTFNQITTTASITVSEPKKQDNNNNGGQTNKVTKTATKIVAKKKTFKAKKKVKKYTITLKAGKKPVKKVWVTLKIKGKKLLKAKTNAKGKATFKIKKLTKKGKYKAIIKFKGNKNYKASSKKVKITIKK